MKKNTLPFQKIQFALTLFIIIVIFSQILYNIYFGENFCVSDGCKIVEKTLNINPTTVNILGFLFFTTYLVLLGLFNRLLIPVDFLRSYLLLGIIVEGILISFQLFIAKAFCLYCIFVFFMLLMLNTLWGAKQLLKAMVILSTEIIILSIPNFTLTSKLNIDNGTFAIKSCEKPLKRAYLFFSKDCRHCKEVLKNLEGCTACEIYLNPLEKLDKNFFENTNLLLQFNKNYDPALNISILKMLKINEIPVLISEEEEGLTFIKGEKAIQRYLQKACTHHSLIDNKDVLLNNLFNPNPFTINKEPADGACKIDKKCE